MSWAEVKKAVNSDLSTPLNHLIWLNDYKTFGEDSYVFQNKDVLHELYSDYELCMNDAAILQELIDFSIANNNVGKAFASIYGIESADVLTNLDSLSAVINNEIAMTAIANNSAATNIVLNTDTIMTAVINSEIAMAALIKNNTFMTAVLNSDAYMADVTNSGEAIKGIAKSSADWSCKKPFIIKLNGNSDYIKNVFTILNNTEYFTIKTTQNFDVVKELNAYTTEEYAKDGFIACSLGYYTGNSGYGTRLKINGDTIKELKYGITSEYPSSRPTSVTSSNINAIAIPVATFEDISDGHAAITVFIAN